MQDRLADLRFGGDDEALDLESGSIVPGAGYEEEPDAGDSGVLQSFFEDVNEIKSQMAIVRRNIRTIEEKHSQALSSVTMEQNKETSEELTGISDSTDEIIRQLNQRLKQMQKDNKAFVDANQGTAQSRIRVNMHGTLTRQLMELTSEYREVQAKYRQKQLERVERQYRIVNPDANAEEISAALEAPDSAEIFAHEILSPGHTAAKHALEDIQAQKREVLRLEASIAELHQLFVDMAVLVEAQGELLDQIEYNVESCVQYTEKGVKELEKARKYQKKSRKNMIILIVILIAIFVVIVIILALMSAVISTVLGVTIPSVTSASG